MTRPGSGVQKAWVPALLALLASIPVGSEPGVDAEAASPGKAAGFDGPRALDRLAGGPGTLPRPGWRVEIDTRSWEQLPETLETGLSLMGRGSRLGAGLAFRRLDTPQGAWTRLWGGLILGGDRSRAVLGARLERFEGEQVVPLMARVIVNPVPALSVDAELEHVVGGPPEATRMEIGAYVGWGDWSGGLRLGPADRLSLSLGLRATRGVLWSARFDGSSVGAGVDVVLGRVEVGGRTAVHPLLGRIARARLRVEGGA